jgi:hypothetical protein
MRTLKTAASNGKINREPELGTAAHYHQCAERIDLIG